MAGAVRARMPGGHRPLPSFRRDKTVENPRWIADGIITTADMDGLIDDLSSLLEALIRFRNHAEAAHNRVS